MTEAYYRKTTQQALEAQQAGMSGLSDQEAGRRREQYGPNKLSEGKKKSAIQVFAEQFKELPADRAGAVRDMVQAWKSEPDPHRP